MSMSDFYQFVDADELIRGKYRSRFFSLKCSRKISIKHSIKTSQKSSLKVSQKSSLNNPIKADILVASNRCDDET